MSGLNPAADWHREAAVRICSHIAIYKAYLVIAVGAHGRAPRGEWPTGVQS